ncbi:hypothetical protein ACSSV6_004081 [Roseovarius sp. MBR-38]
MPMLGRPEVLPKALPCGQGFGLYEKSTPSMSFGFRR